MFSSLQRTFYLVNGPTQVKGPSQVKEPTHLLKLHDFLNSLYFYLRVFDLSFSSILF